MNNIIYFIWQIPQNIIALIWIGILSVLKGKPEWATYKGIKYAFFKNHRNGVSLGNFVILGTWYRYSDNTIKHEYGHTRQSLYFGPLYLILIGIPSACGNLFDRIFHKKWSYDKSEYWYYNQPWEKWADKLGEVERF